MKLFKFYNYWSDFITDKISDSEDNSTYMDFENNESVLGTPNVMYNQVCFIEDKKCIWTHGQKYTSAEAAGVSQEDLDLAIKKHTDKQPKDLMKGLAQSLNYDQNFASLSHYSIMKNSSGDYTDLTTYNTYMERATDKPSYVRVYGSTYTDADGNEQNTYKYYAYGHAGLMGVDDVRAMWQPWHATRYMPDKLVGYTSAGADKDNAYITAYYKAEEGDVYNTTEKILAEDGKTWTGKFKTRKEYGRWKSENTNLPLASTISAGVITAADKTKLDGLQMLGDFNVSSESGNASGVKVVRENFSPSDSAFSDLVSVQFKKGDKIVIEADLSKCEKAECEMVAFGKDISDWGNKLDEGKGVFHLYHKHSGSSHNILVNYVDKANQGGLKYNGNTGVAITGDTVTIELGYDATLLKPFLTINGTNVIGTSSFVTVNAMNSWLDQKSIYIGSVSEASTGKLTNILYNSIRIDKGEATSADGVKVQYAYGDDVNEFVIPNATTTTNGAMSLEDKKKLDGLREYSVATQTEDGLMSKEDKLKLDNMSSQSSEGSFDGSSSLPLQFALLAQEDPTGRPYTYLWTTYEGGDSGYPLYIAVDSSYENRQGNNNLTEICLSPNCDTNGKKYLDVIFNYMSTRFKLNINKMIELGLLEAI